MSEALLTLVKKYIEKDPARAALELETLDEAEAAQVIEALPEPMAMECVTRLSDVHAAGILKSLPEPLFKSIVNQLQASQSAQIFLRFNQEFRHTLLNALDEDKKRAIHEYLLYPEDSAGRIMTTDLTAFHGDLSVSEVIQKIRKAAQKNQQLSYVYVTDRNGKLTGVLNMRDVILAEGHESLEQIMRKNVFTVDCFMDKEKVAQEFMARRFFSAPVVDAQGKLLGVVKADQLLDDVQDEATEDMQKMFGAGGDERAFSPVLFSIRKRLPWLLINLVTAFLAAWVVSLFEDLIAKITVLAVFLPVVAGQGGNSGNQSLAVVMRGLVMREISPDKAGSLIMKEAVVGLTHGVLIGLATALGSWLWYHNAYLGLVVGLGMIVNLTVAGFSGAVIPLTMKALKLDPAQCSSIILTTITDVMGFFAFLGFAVLFKSYLV